MQTSKQPFPPDFVYLLHAAPRHPLVEQFAGHGGDADEADEQADEEDEELADYDDAD